MLRAGAIAGALAAVIGISSQVLRLATGSGGSETIEPSATIQGVDVGDLVGIRAGFARTSLARECPNLPATHLTVSRPRPPALQAGTLFAQAGSTDVEAPTETGGTTTTTTTSTSTSTTTSTSTATSTARLTSTSPTMGATPVQVGVASHPTTILRPDGIRVINEVRPVIPPTPSPTGPTTVPTVVKAEALTVAPEDYSPEQEKQVTAQAALVKTSTGTAEPVGRLVDLSVAFHGLKHRCIQLRWSLYEAPTGVRAKELWLRDRPALRFVPDRQDQSASQQFWVPVPRRGGRFFVRMGLFEPDGTRLTVARTEMFEVPGGDKNGFVT